MISFQGVHFDSCHIHSFLEKMGKWLNSRVAICDSANDLCLSLWLVINVEYFSDEIIFGDLWVYGLILRYLSWIVKINWRFVTTDKVNLSFVSRDLVQALFRHFWHDSLLKSFVNFVKLIANQILILVRVQSKFAQIWSLFGFVNWVKIWCIKHQVLLASASVSNRFDFSKKWLALGWCLHERRFGHSSCGTRSFENDSVTRNREESWIDRVLGFFVNCLRKVFDLKTHFNWRFNKLFINFKDNLYLYIIFRSINSNYWRLYTPIWSKSE